MEAKEKLESKIRNESNRSKGCHSLKIGNSEKHGIRLYQVRDRLSQARNGNLHKSLSSCINCFASASILKPSTSNRFDI